jgi:hypothetical protein
VLLAAAASGKGASRAICDSAASQGWDLLSSPYAIDEVFRNLRKLSPQATGQWVRLRPRITLVDDVLTIDRPVVFGASKDRPVLFTALAWADVLLTLDKQDFAKMLGGTFYGLHVLLPYDFLERERSS